MTRIACTICTCFFSASLARRSQSDASNTTIHAARPAPTTLQEATGHHAALWSLAAHSAANQEAIRAAGGVCLLVTQLVHSTSHHHDAPDLAGHTAGALWSLSEDSEIKVSIAQASTIPPLVHTLGTGDALLNKINAELEVSHHTRAACMRWVTSSLLWEALSHVHLSRKLALAR